MLYNQSKPHANNTSHLPRTMMIHLQYTPVSKFCNIKPTLGKTHRHTVADHEVLRNQLTCHMQNNDDICLVWSLGSGHSNGLLQDDKKGQTYYESIKTAICTATGLDLLQHRPTFHLQLWMKVGGQKFRSSWRKILQEQLQRITRVFYRFFVRSYQYFK